MLGWVLKRKGAAGALGSHSQVFSHHHWYSRGGILLISVEWLKCGIGNSTFHRLRCREKNHCFAIQACFDHSVRILLLLLQLLITVLKGESEQILPSTLWHSSSWSHTRVPGADALFSGGSSSSPNTNTACCASHTHTLIFALLQPD